VVTSFAEWRYPLTLPPEWDVLELPQQENPPATQPCRLSLMTYSVQSAHVVPYHAKDWFTNNIERLYEFTTDNSKNIISLRSDIHWFFDQKAWCVVLKEGRLVCQTFRRYDKELSADFIQMHHNVELEPIYNKSKECLFARIAWTVLPLMEHFCVVRRLSGTTTFIIKDGKSIEVNGKALRMSSKPSKRGSTAYTTTVAPSNKKRPRDDENISISISDWLNQVPSPQNQHPGGYPPVTTGDYLHDRYRIVRRLNFGTHSTVWLVRDEKPGRYVAIKMLK
jgi:HNH endonuclease